MKPREWWIAKGENYDAVFYNDPGYSKTLIHVIEYSAYEKLKTALEKIAKVTYGTEICNSEEENNAILAPWVFSYQHIAREALGNIEGNEK